MAAIALSATTVQAADNMAVHKDRNTGSSGMGTENRLVIPFEGAGYSSPMNGDESYTIGAWVKVTDVRTDAAAGGALLAVAPINHLNLNGNWVLNVSSTGSLSISGHSGENDHGAGTLKLSGNVNGTFKIGEYNYVAVAVDNTNLTFTIFVNGEQVDQKSLSSALYYPSNIHAGDGTGYFCVANYGLVADIDEVHIYNVALDPEYVKAIYGGTVVANGLKGYYTFDEQIEDGKFKNLAADAEEGSEALFFRWYGQITNWGFVSGTNSLTQATLVEGRELDPSAIDNVAVDNANAPVEYFNLNGVKVAADNLGTGIYVRRQGNETKKVLVK